MKAAHTFVLLTVAVTAATSPVTGQTQSVSQQSPVTQTAPGNGAYLTDGVRRLLEDPSLAPQLLNHRSLPLGKDTLHADTEGRVLLLLHFNPKDAETVRQAALALGARMPVAPAILPGRMPVWLPPGQISAAARIPNLRSIALPPGKTLHANPLPSQAAAPLQFNTLPTAFNGTGNVIGVISDSFSDCPDCTTTPTEDVSAGELPGTGNPNGDTSPIVVLADETDGEGTDEGRAIMQVLYRLVPNAKLCFSTDGDTQEDMAASIANLQDPTMGCGANIIVDDISFLDEPFFADGILTQAVDTVAGKGVTYASAAGNEGSALFDGTFTPVTDAAARAGIAGSNLNLTSVADSLTAGGFMNFGTAAKPVISYPLLGKAYYGYPLMQWDDPFIADEVTANYVLLIFDPNGNYESGYSSADLATQTGEPFQVGLAYGGYQMVIALANTPTGTYSKHLRAIALDAAFLTTQPGAATIFGHPDSANALGVAAYPYNEAYVPDYISQPQTSSTAPEAYSDYGPYTQLFDDSYNRLTTPVTRNKPDVAGVDGLDTSFFGQNSDGDSYPNFYGTSAAAPTIAAMAAVVTEALGGPAKAPPATVRAAIINQAANRTWNSQAGYGYASAERAANSVLPATTTAGSYSPSPAYVGQTITLSAKVAKTGTLTPTGTVSFSFNGILLQSVALPASGTASFAVATNGLPAGTYPITAAYSGDAANRSSSTTSAIEVVLGASATLTTLTANPNPVTPPAAITFTATVKRTTAGTTGSPTGSVGFYIGTSLLDTATLSNGVATYKLASTNGLTAGTYTLTAKYEGDSADSTSSGNSAVTVK